ncbi:MAG TPA: glycosyltransferase [Longimicrobiales bacterium]|nr:glycosyltransferase [Longimicrobiales bacterium]
MTALAAFTAAGWAVACWMLVRGLRRIPRLSTAEPAPESVAIIVAARDEERDVERAVRSLLAQEHPGLEVVVVDDRSGDATGAILDRMARDHGALRVLHVASLPAGWLGKNHALHEGAATVAADWLVFADADVIMRPDAVASAVAHARGRGLDHLAVFPRMIARGALLNATVGVFTVLFALRFRPWAAADPESRAHIGVGAFNLVRRTAYEAMGGHRSIALRPDDDLRLGRALKEAGGRSAAAFGDRLLAVEWYRSVPDLVRGLRKNAFAAVEYRPWLVAVVVALLLAFHVGPFAALLLTEGVARLLFGAAAGLAMLSLDRSAGRFGVTRTSALLYPAGALVVAYAIGAATVRALWTGGVEWRGTIYPLAALREETGSALAERDAAPGRATPG